MTEIEAVIHGSALLEEAKTAIIEGKLGEWYETRLQELVDNLEQASREDEQQVLKRSCEMGQAVFTAVWVLRLLDITERRKQVAQ